MPSLLTGQVEGQIVLLQPALFLLWCSTKMVQPYLSVTSAKVVNVFGSDDTFCVSLFAGPFAVTIG